MRTIPTLIALVALIVLVCPAAALAGPAAPPEALRAFNEDFVHVWSRLEPELAARLKAEAVAALQDLTHREGDLEVQVRSVRDVQVDIRAAPGFRHFSTDRLVLAIPESGEWRLEVEVRIRVKLRSSFLPLRFDVPVTLEVKRLVLEARIDLDDATDPARPTITSASPPSVGFKIELDSSSAFYDLIFRALTPTANKLAKDVVKDALRDLAPAFSAFAVGAPGTVPGDGAPPYADSGAPTPFLDVVRGVDAKIRQAHLPYGLLMRARLDAPAHDTWLAAYGPGGPGIQGNVLSNFGYGDSAIWSGHYLASQAFRHAATGELEALDNVRAVLEGMGRLLEIYGGSGLLVRAAAPMSSPLGQEFVQRGHYKQGTIAGQPWVGWLSDAGISRDQYSGAFFGLALAHDLVADPAVKAECARRIQQMLDYLVAKRWLVDEDRVPFSSATGMGFPTFWLGVDHQRLAFLLIGNRVAPGRYDAELKKWAPLTSTAWFGLWSSTFDLEHHYKFNLDQIALYNYFRLETDPQRWQEMARGFRMMRRYVGHQRNPHFDLMASSIDPALRTTLFPCVRESVRRFLDRNHRELAPPVVDLSGVQWTTQSVADLDLVTGQVKRTQVTLPTEPLDIPLRAYTGFLLWQKTPFDPAVAGQGDAMSEGPGIDLVLPYWMGRYHGAF